MTTKITAESLEAVTAILVHDTHIGLCGRVDKFGVETALELRELGWMPFSLNGNGLPRPLEYSAECIPCEESRATECPLPPPPRPPRVGLVPPLPGLVLKSADSLFAPPSFFLSRLLFTSWKLAAPSRPKLRLVSTLQKNKKQ
jgi:hypothetical protein